MSFIQDAQEKASNLGWSVQTAADKLNKTSGNSEMMKAISQGYGSISGSNAKYLLRQGTSNDVGPLLDPSNPQGSVIMGGISYSGADIKVCLLCNHQMTADQAAKANGADALRADEYLRRAKALQQQANIWKTKALQSKGGTQEKKYYSTLQYQALTEAQTYMAAIKNLPTMGVDEKGKPAIKGGKYKAGGISPAKVLAEAQTLSISVFRDKQSVRSLGTTYPKGFTRGPRQIGGTLVFTVFDRDVFFEILQAHPSDFDGISQSSSAIMDQLPPVDILVSFANELGSISRMALYGVEFVSNGQVMSIEDILTENQVEYVARDFDPMSSVGVLDLTKSIADIQVWKTKTGSSLLDESDFRQIKDAVDPFQRQKRRNDSYL